MYVYDWLLWFILYSIVGWAFESLQFTIYEKKFVNRGFLNGPLCPVYGFGALLIFFILENRTDSLVILFFAAVALTTTLEYITAVILEHVFHAKWWDYSMFPMNFKGRVSPISSAVFGVLSVVGVKIVQPFVQDLTDKISLHSKLTFLSFFVIYFFIDFTITVRHILLLNGRLSEIQTALNCFFGKYYKRAGEFRNAILVSFEESEFYSERIKTLFNLDRIQNRRIIRAFPKLRSFNYDDALKKLRARVLNLKDNDEADDDQ
jgi:uncharacterized membrane protein